MYFGILFLTDYTPRSSKIYPYMFSYNKVYPAFLLKNLLSVVFSLHIYVCFPDGPNLTAVLIEEEVELICCTL